MPSMIKSSALLFAVACCSTGYGQLMADISVETTVESDGRLRYEYLIENLPQSEFTINTFLLDVGEGAEIELLAEPPGWVGDYAAAEDPYELGWVAQSPPTEIQIGGSGSFSFLSPLEPGEIEYVIGRLAGENFEGVIFDTVAGPLVAPAGGVPGDYNDNGQVEQADLNLVLLNWGEPFAAIPDDWVNERPAEGIVDQVELNRVLLNWGATAASIANVPEPATAVLLILCGLLVGLNRRNS